jgi:hypothetical protein
VRLSSWQASVEDCSTFSILTMVFIHLFVSQKVLEGGGERGRGGGRERIARERGEGGKSC